MADLVVNASTARVQPVATVAMQASFDFDFLVEAAADLRVFWTDASAGLTTELTLTTEFTVSGIGVFNGGSVTLVDPSAIEIGDTLTIYRDIEIKRLSEFQLNGEFPSGTINAELRKVFEILQEFRRDINRSITLAPEDTASEFTIPVDRKGKILHFDETTGEPLATISAGPLADVSQAVIDAEAAAVAAAASAAAAATFDPANFVGRTGGATGAANIPIGTTAQRPSDAAGLFRINTTTGLAEINFGASFVPLALAAVTQRESLPVISNGTDTANDIDVAAGFCIASGANPIAISIASALGKQLDAVWATGGTPGTPTGGRFDANISDGTWAVYAISNGSSANAGFSKDLNDPSGEQNFPSGYSFLRIGYILRVSSSIVLFSQNGPEFLLKAAGTEVGTTNPTTNAVLPTLAPFPSGVKLPAIIDCALEQAGATITYGLVSSPDQDDEIPTSTLYNIGAASNSAGNAKSLAQRMLIRSDAVSRVRYRVSFSDASTTFRLRARGWIDDRV